MNWLSRLVSKRVRELENGNAKLRDENRLLSDKQETIDRLGAELEKKNERIMELTRLAANANVARLKAEGILPSKPRHRGGLVYRQDVYDILYHTLFVGKFSFKQMLEQWSELIFKLPTYELPETSDETKAKHQSGDLVWREDARAAAHNAAINGCRCGNAHPKYDDIATKDADKWIDALPAAETHEVVQAVAFDMGLPFLLDDESIIQKGQQALQLIIDLNGEIFDKDALIADLRERLKTEERRREMWIEKYDSQVLRVAELEETLTHLRHEYDRAKNTLEYAGYTDQFGELWKPPLGKRPDHLLERIAELEQQLHPSESAHHDTDKYYLDPEQSTTLYTPTITAVRHNNTVKFTLTTGEVKNTFYVPLEHADEVAKQYGVEIQEEALPTPALGHKYRGKSRENAIAAIKKRNQEEKEGGLNG